MLSPTKDNPIEIIAKITVLKIMNIQKKMRLNMSEKVTK